MSRVVLDILTQCGVIVHCSQILQVGRIWQVQFVSFWRNVLSELSRSEPTRGCSQRLRNVLLRVDDHYESLLNCRMRNGTCEESAGKNVQCSTCCLMRRSNREKCKYRWSPNGSRPTAPLAWPLGNKIIYIFLLIHPYHLRNRRFFNARTKTCRLVVFRFGSCVLIHTRLGK